MANAYVIAIGEKMTPATPVIVKRGRKATPMMSVENVIGPATSRAPARIRSFIVPFPCPPRCRKMFSIMMTVESTTIPKSTAPSEIRFAGVCVPTIPHERDEERERDVDRGDERGAELCPRKRKRTIATSSIPVDEVLEDRVGRELHEVPAVVVGDDVHPRRQNVVLPDVVDAVVDPAKRARRLPAVAHEDDPLNDVGVVVVTDDPEAGCRADARLGDVADANGDPLRLGEDDVLDVVHVLDETDRADRVGLLADDEALPADVRVRGLHRLFELVQGDALPAQAIGIDADMVLLRLAAEAHDVDDARGPA